MKEVVSLHLVPDTVLGIYDIDSIEFSDGIVLQCGRIDPQINLNLPIHLENPPSPVYCEITYTSTAAGILQVFWDYGEGLREENSTKEVCFSVAETRSMLLPIVNWKTDEKLVALRIDPPDGARFILKGVSVLCEKYEDVVKRLCPDGFIKLHLGCGTAYKEEWINIDNNSDNNIEKLDINYDLRKPLPFPDNSVDFIYNEHFLEHLTVEEGIAAIKGFYRVLKPGGVMRIAMPDLEKTVYAYLDENWEKNSKATLEKLGLSFIQTRAERINISFRWWGHKWLYDWEELERRLKEAGCEKIKRCSIFESEHEELKNLETRNESTLIAEVIKT